MIAVRGRSKASRVGPAAELDQPSSAGPSAALPGCETSMSVVYPARGDTCNLTGDAALLEVAAARCLLLACGTVHGMNSAADTHHKLCGGVAGLSGVPRAVRLKK